MRAWHRGSTVEAAGGIVGGALPGEGPVCALEEAQHLHQHVRGAGVEHAAVRARHHLPIQPRNHLGPRQPAHASSNPTA